MTETVTRKGPLAGKTVTDLLVTAESVIRDLDRWEYVYRDECAYRDNRGAPSCLIGHVLYRWGALDAVKEGLAYYSLQELAAPSEVAQVAAAIQAEQDAGITWSEALEYGHRRAVALGVER